MARSSTRKKSKKTTTSLSEYRTDIQKKWRQYSSRNPHQSFQKTYRRDYARSLEIPGYFRLTQEVLGILRKNAKLFGGLVAVYTALVALFVGFASQETYSDVRDLLNESGQTLLSGGWGDIGKAFLLLGSSWRGTFLPQLTDAQQVYSSLLVVFVWLTTIWLLRAIMSGKSPRLRDGMYNSGAPFVPTIILSIVLLVQLAPLAVAVIGYGAATETGILSGGVEAMIFWIVASMLVLLSLYWASSTVMALVVVTLPGVYPWKALQSGADIVLGRRLRLLLRLVWLVALIIIAWVVVVIPAILIDNWFSGAVAFWDSIPFIPVVLLFVSSVSTLFSASYVYILYRKVVEYDSTTS